MLLPGSRNRCIFVQMPGWLASPWHPLAFAVQPVVALHAANHQIVRWNETLRCVVVVLGAVVCVWMVLRLILRDGRKAAILTSVTCFSFFFWGHFVAMVVRPEWVYYKTPIFIAYATSFAALAFWMQRVRQLFAITRFLNMFGLILVALPLGSLMVEWVGQSHELRQHGRASTTSEWTACISAAVPRDVYIIVLDAYPRADVLQREFCFDNTAFVSNLERQGFHVASKSRANYQKTLWSLASFLNAGYLDEFLSVNRPDSSDLRPLVTLFRRNRLFGSFSDSGYEIIAFETGFELAELKTSVDHFYSTGKWLSEFESLLLQTTPMLQILRKIGGQHILFEEHRARVRFVFRKIRDLAVESGHPKLVWAHVVTPHDPIVFGSQGEPVQLQDRFIWGQNPPANLSREAYRKAYSDQLEYLNRLILETIHSLIDDSPTDPVVLVISDHGLLTAEIDLPAVLFKNLCALFLPCKNESAIVPEDLSLVNVVPLMMNACFGCRIPMKPKNISYIVSWDAPSVYTAIEMEE